MADPSNPNEPPVSELLRTLVGRAARRGRDELARAAEAGRAQLELRQARKDLQDFWVRLGKTAYRLVEAGETDHPALVKARDRIDEIEARIAELEARVDRKP
jgi:hypothetical protein